MAENKPTGKLSRRGFLRGSVVASASAAIAGHAHADDPTAPAAAAAAPPSREHAEVQVSCEVNGQAHQLSVGPDTSTLDVIREKLGLTGAKTGCGHGACGACTMLVDGSPHATCLLPAVALQGREVTTVEGIAAGPNPADLHPVQRAFAGEDAMQCGFCTPGFVVESAAFVDAWRAANGDRRPPRPVVSEALSGHLCRCGAYENIIKAVQVACTGQYDRPGVQAARVEALDKVTGAAIYTVDVQLDGQLHGRILRSTVAHGVLRTIDVRPALGIPAVKAAVVITPEGHKVRFAGQELAAVAAPTREAADAALAAIRVEIDPLPPVLSMRAARRADAPLLYGRRDDAESASEAPVLRAKWDGNVRGPVSSAVLSRPRAAQKKLDELAATEPADSRRYIKQTYVSHVQCHTALEPHAAVARFNADGSVELWASTQSVGDLAEDVAQRFKVKRDQVTVYAHHVGGGFGAKVGLQVEGLTALRLARESGAPVAVINDREAELVAGGVRPAQEMTVALATEPDGALLAMGLETYNDSGVAIGNVAGLLGRIMYPTPFKVLDDYDVVTNATPGRPFRGPGGPGAFFALEGAIDDLASRRKMSPIKLRRRWDPNPQRQRLYRWAESLPVWRDRAQVRQTDGRYRVGVGLAAGGWMPFLDPGTRVQLDASLSGIVASTTCQDIGTGARSVIAHSVARILDLSPHQITVVVGESGKVHGPMSAGSRTTPSVGPAAEDAAHQLIEALVEQAEVVLGLTGVVAEVGGLRHAAGALSWTELLELLPAVTVVGRRRRDPDGYFLPFAVQDLNASKTLPGSVQVAKVRVDTLLGRVEVQSVDIGMGVGRIYIPTLAENQVQGAVLQGVSYALYEDRRLDPVTGRLLTTGLEDYRIAGVADCPHIRVMFDEDGFEGVTGGGIGLGELSTVGIAGAVANAVFDATGWRPKALPLTPRRVLAGLQEDRA